MNITKPLKLRAFSGAIRPFLAVAWRKSLKLLGLCDALSRFGGDPAAWPMRAAAIRPPGDPAALSSCIGYADRLAMGRGNSAAIRHGVENYGTSKNRLRG